MDESAATIAPSAGSAQGSPARLTSFQILRLSSMWLGLQVFWVTQQLILMDERVKHFVPNEHVGTYLGLLRGAGAVMVLLSQLTVGFISDHTVHKLGPRRPWIIWGTLTGLLGIAGFILAPSYWWLFAAYLFLELTLNAASVAFQSLLPDLVPASQHDEAGKQMGLNHLGGALISVVIFAVMSFLLSGKTTVLGDVKPEGYVPVLLPAYVGFLLLTMLIVVTGIDEHRWRQHVIEPLQGKVRELCVLPGVIARYTQTRPTLLGQIVDFYSKVSLRDNRNLFWLAVSRFAIHLGYSTFLGFIFLYAIANLDSAQWLEGLGLPAAKAAELASGGAAVTCVLIIVFIIGGLCGNLASVPLARRFGRKWVISTGIITAGLLFIPLILTRNVNVALLAGVLVGMGWGAFIASDWAFACTLMPKQKSGAFMGLWDATTLLPQIFAPIISGPLRDAILRANAERLGEVPAEALAYQWVFALVILYFAVGLVLLRPLQEAR
jgi:MFS family permease